jgi:hypothetical protein
VSKKKELTEEPAEEIHWNQQRYLDERAEAADAGNKQPKSKKTKAQTN